ncbi:hypothetical protein SAMN04515666_1013 [Bosea lupini]|uniref:Phage gp6-like head-tail connector protein n=1 Tax=Bosea lupini TaxID=1036779 RepID=A0A1H7FJC9_9HYPH|nr:hypothetical protein [Bosea lupini]SEK23415.1 hypothetical protein SAMN04515666_1013 [Bosea lupini]
MLEVITAAENRKLTTLAAVKADLGLTGAEEDARLDALIEQYSAAIVGWCGRPFALEMLRETIFSPAATNGLMLSCWPVVSIASITLDGVAIAPEAYTVDRNAGLVHQRQPGPSGFWWPRGETVATYAAGYILPGSAERTLPYDVERAAIMLVKAAFLAAERDPHVRSDSVEGVGTTTWFSTLGTAGDAMPLEVQGLLTPYHHLTVG